MADMTVTAANVVPAANATKSTVIAGVTVTAGQLVYKNTSDSDKYHLCDVDASAEAALLGGIALNGASDGQPLEIQTAGDVNPGGTVVVGKHYMASDTAGGIKPVDDIDLGDYSNLLGIGTSTSNILLGIINGGVAVP